MSLDIGVQIKDRETKDEFKVVDIGRVWVSYSGSAGEGSVRADMLEQEFEVLASKPVRCPH